MSFEGWQESKFSGGLGGGKSIAKLAFAAGAAEKEAERDALAEENRKLRKKLQEVMWIHCDEIQETDTYDIYIPACAHIPCNEARALLAKEPK